QTTQTATGLASGSYGVTVTDANGCTASTTVDVNIIQPPSVSIDKQDILCFEDNNGTASAMVSNGTAPFSFLWSNGATTADISNLGPGEYGVTVTDAKGCTDAATVTIIEPFMFKIDFAKADVICNGDANGSALAQGWGGTAPYTYLWSTGETTEEITNLAAGTYGATVTDANGCVATGEVTIEEKAPITISVDVADTGCVANATTSATANASGGNGNYQYLWSNDQTTQTATNLISGSYGVTVTDENGCTGSTTVNVSITQPPSVSIDKQDILCFEDNNGTASAMVSNGTAPFTYQWSNGATTAGISNLGPGDYGVTVTDAKGCTDAASVTIIEPFMFKIDFAKADAICNGEATGSALAQGWGGTPPFTYLWSTGETTEEIKGLASGIYSATVTDANGCVATGEVEIGEPESITVSFEVGNTICTDATTTSATAIAMGGNGSYAVYQWSDGQTTTTATGLSAGTYGVTVTDVNGCTGEGSVSISFSAPPVVSIDKTDVSCKGDADGSLTANVNGAAMPFSYAWSNGATTATISDLAPGNYGVTVTTADGCTASASATITEPTALVSNVLVQDNVCADEATGTATIMSSGGTPPYTYNWSTGATSNQISGLAAGDYSVTSTDANGCEAISNFSISAPGLLDLVVGSSDVSCGEDADGTAMATAVGGTPPYAYLWSNGDNTASVAGLAPGTYTVSVTDSNGCMAEASVTIGQDKSFPDIKGYAWGDADRNGLQGSYERGVHGVMVDLIKAGPDNKFGTADDMVVESQTTGNDGLYRFRCVPAGEYQVRFSMIPVGYQFTAPGQGNGTNDSDADPTDGSTFTVSVAAGGPDICDIDAGIYRTCIPLDNAGEIAADQEICRGTQPAMLTGTVPSTFGDMEYVWMSNDENLPFSSQTWTMIEGSNSQNYQPGQLFATTYFIRCVRRKGCETYIESNIVRVGVKDCRSAFIDFEANAMDNGNIQLN
ncbi:MAG: SdrD B-like domain-containing protein, partial [Bacteroidota bacterium]